MNNTVLKVLLTILAFGLIGLTGLIAYQNGKSTGEEIGTEKGKDIGFKNGYKTGLQEGKEAGFDQGYTVGITEKPRVSKRLIRQLIEGAAVVMADEQIKNSLDYEHAVTVLDSLDDAYTISSRVKFIANEANEVMLETLSTVGGLSTRDKKVLLENYQANRKTLTEEVAKRYQEGIRLDAQRREDLRSIVERTNDFTSAHSQTICTLISFLSPHSKAKIAAKIVREGKNMISNQSSVSATEVELTSLVMDELCEILLEKGATFSAGLYKDFAQMVQYSNDFLIEDQGIESVMKLVSAEMNTSSIRQRTFERDYAFDPNYTITTKANILAGIDLKKFYKIDITRRTLTESGKTEIIVTIPEPQILQVFVDVTPTSDNEYVATKLKDIEMQQIYREEEQIARRQAIQKGILDDARTSARQAIYLMYKPLLMNADDDYIIKVNFARQAPANNKELELN